MSLSLGSVESYASSISDAKVEAVNDDDENLSNDTRVNIGVSDRKPTIPDLAGPGNPYMQGKFSRKLITPEKWYRFGFLYFLYALVAITFIVMASFSAVDRRVSLGAYTFLFTIIFEGTVIALLVWQHFYMYVGRYLPNRSYFLALGSMISETILAFSLQIPLMVRIDSNYAYFNPSENSPLSEDDDFALLFQLANFLVIAHLSYLLVGVMHMIGMCWFDPICQSYQNRGMDTVA